jgi:1-acyl-sn-glycerol-3-phosphate acyltransferase
MLSNAMGVVGRAIGRLLVSESERRRLEGAGFHDAGHGYDVFGLSPAWLAAAERLTRPLYRGYFRVESQGIEAIPRSGPVILAANHSGMLPLDGLMLALDVLRLADPPRIPRVVLDHFVPQFPVIGPVFARVGAIGGTRTNAHLVLERGELLVLFPEGTDGIGKPFSHRYQLQGWRVGHVELAIRHRAPVVPVAIVGAEEQWPQLTRLPIRALGIPYLPLPASLLPLPAKYHVRYGEPIAFHERFSPQDADDPFVLAQCAQTVKEAVASLIVQALAARKGVFR